MRKQSGRKSAQFASRIFRFFSFFSVLIAFANCLPFQTASAQERDLDRGGKDSGKETRRKNARLNFKTFTYSMAQEKVKSKVTQKAGSTTTSEVTSEQTQNVDRWNFYSAEVKIPLLLDPS